MEASGTDANGLIAVNSAILSLLSVYPVNDHGVTAAEKFFQHFSVGMELLRKLRPD